MYLREMGSVELLSREGEIAIAKRIEAGRETMIQGLCESPLTFQALIIWRDELNEGTTLLREIIDLETTYSGPEAKAAPQFQSPEKIEADRKAAEEKEKARRARVGGSEDDDITNVGGEGPCREEEEEDEDECNLSLAAMEARTASAGHGDPRPDRRDLQEAAQAAGPAGGGAPRRPPPRCRRPRSAATRSSRTS